LCGLWHGASWNFVIWGLFHGGFLVLERLAGVKPGAPAGSPLLRPLRHVYTLLVVLVGWVFFRAETLPGALAVLRAMAGLAHPTTAVPGVGMFVDSEVVVAAALGIVGSAPWLPALGRRLAPRRDAGAPGLELARLVGLCAVFVGALALMAAGSYSPF